MLILLLRKHKIMLRGVLRKVLQMPSFDYKIS